MQPLYATLLSYPKQYATAYGNGMQPLMETVLSYPRQYATALCNRLWKRYVTAYRNGVSPPKIPRTPAPILKKG